MTALTFFSRKEMLSPIKSADRLGGWVGEKGAAISGMRRAMRMMGVDERSSGWMCVGRCGGCADNVSAC